MIPEIAPFSNGELFYLDSGPVPDSDNFSTVIAVHGMCFNAYCFEPLFYFAHKRNIRLVVVQRKDYRGSSECTEEELDSLAEDPSKFLARMGALFAQFVHHIVVNTGVCKPTKDRSGGGVSVLGWSLGNVFTMSMFESRGVLDTDAYALVESYITNLIIYEAPHVAIGAKLSDISGVADEEPAAPFDDFQYWTSCYYDHPSQWDGTVSNLDLRPRTNQCTLESWSEAKKAKCTESFALRSDLPLHYPPAQKCIRRFADKVLYSTDQTSRAFPRARITFIHGRRSTWPCVLAWTVVERKHNDLLNQRLGNRLRPMRFKAVEWGNHLIHSDYPSEFMEIVSEAIRTA